MQSINSYEAKFASPRAYRNIFIDTSVTEHRDNISVLKPQFQNLFNSLNFRTDCRQQLTFCFCFWCFFPITHHFSEFAVERNLSLRRAAAFTKRRYVAFSEQQPAFSKHMVSKCPFGNSAHSPGAGTHIHLIKTDLQVKISSDLECRSFPIDAAEHEVLPRCAYCNKMHTCRNNNQTNSLWLPTYVIKLQSLKSLRPVQREGAGGTG